MMKNLEKSFFVFVFTQLVFKLLFKVIRQFLIITVVVVILFLKRL